MKYYREAAQGEVERFAQMKELALDNAEGFIGQADKKKLKYILGFLDEEVYKGSFSNATYITNSKRSVS